MDPLEGFVEILRSPERGAEVETLVQPPPKKRNSKIPTLNRIRQYIDTLNPDRLSELTITFNEKYYQKYDEDETKLSIALNNSIRRGITLAVKYVYEHADLPEPPVLPNLRIILVGEHGIQGRFHYHGVIMGIPNDILSRLQKYIKSVVGRTTLKMILKYEQYIDYMFKSFEHEDEDNNEAWGPYSAILINIPLDY